MTTTVETPQDLTDLTCQLHMLIQQAPVPVDRDTAYELVTRVESVLCEYFRLKCANGYLVDVLETAPQWQSEVERLEVGQQHLLAELQALRPLAEKVDNDDEMTSNVFMAMWSRWVAHVATHEYLEGRLLQDIYNSETGGEA